MTIFELKDQFNAVTNSAKSVELHNKETYIDDGLNKASIYIALSPMKPRWSIAYKGDNTVSITSNSSYTIELQVAGGSSKTDLQSLLYGRSSQIRGWAKN